MAAANWYEEQRRRQVEENKRKLDELRLLTLSAAVRQAAAPTKPRNPRPWNPKLDAPIRRSGRIADLPQQPDYRTGKTHRNTASPAFIKAEELKGQLGSDHPTFIKPMSHDSAKSNQLYLPAHFRQYLPAHREMMVLVDEVNNEFHVSYGICGRDSYVTRWRAFAADHKLVGGDCLVFQLIGRKKFKVYIVRASSCNKNDH